MKRNFNGGSSSFTANQSGNWRGRVASLVAARGATKVRDPSRPVSHRTRVEANQNVQRIFGWLRQDLGFGGLSNPNALDERHFVALAGHIRKKKEAAQIGAAMAAGYATYTRHLARWIDKPHLLAVFNQALGKDVCRRTLTAERDKSWQAAGVDIEKKIVEVMAYERWVGLVLWCQHAFGLRKTEALMLQPLKDIEPVPSVTPGVSGKKGRPVKVDMTKLHWKAWHGGVNVNITRGTKGKRPRVLHINEDNDDAKETAYMIRQEVLDYGDRDTLGPPWFTLKQNARTYERVLARFDITHKDLGITGHGLRAGFACDMVESFGVTPTVRGGDCQHPDPVTQRIAYKSTTEALGHGRLSVIGAYAGCITPEAAARLRKAKAAPGEPCGRA